LLGLSGSTSDMRELLDARPVISVSGSPCTVRVVPTDEDRMIARSTARLLSL
jgi:acetate kinase